MAARGVNRGVAIAGDRVFVTTDHAHLIALNRATGALLWETEMADWRQNYNGTGAPLVVDDLVISGIAGGDEGVRGFVAAFDQATGKEVWRFWAVPARGEPGSETWKGSAIDHPGAATWMTGSYDPELGTLYWAIGNPGPDMIGDDRLGDNLYSDSVVALDVKTGRASGTSSSRRTTCTTTTRSSRSCSWTRRGRGSRASCCCRPTATASSTCSIASPASTCSARRS